MGTHRLPDGREVYLTRLALAPTYAGVLEGGPEAASPHILERLPEQSEKREPPPSGGRLAP